MENHVEENLEEESFSFESTLPLQPRIFEGAWHESIPNGFDAVTISLDGHVQSDLDWKKAREQAQCAVEKGYSLMWKMRLGVFNELLHPLTHQTQFLTLTLSLEHFRDSLWKEFKSQTLGISIFQGPADFSQSFPWDSYQEQNLKAWLQEETEDPYLKSLDLSQLRTQAEGEHLIRLFCRDVAVEYLALLATRLPDSLATYLYLDLTSLPLSLDAELQLLNPERFERFRLALKGQRLPFEAWGWKDPTFQGYCGYSFVELPKPPSISVGVCVPPMNYYHSHHYQGLEKGLHALQKKGVPFKIIAESQLTSMWDGLDYLLFSPTGLSTQGKRKLQGFCAAGGTVVSTGALLGLPYEMGLIDWIETF